MTNDQVRHGGSAGGTTPMTKRKRTHATKRSIASRDSWKLYQVIVQCTDEAQQRELYERLTREGLHCRLVVL